MINQFAESIKRLYISGLIEIDKVVELYESGKITEEEKEYILNAL